MSELPGRPSAGERTNRSTSATRSKLSHHINTAPQQHISDAHRRQQVKQEFSTLARTKARTKAQLLQQHTDKRRDSWHQPNDVVLQDDESSIGSWGSLCEQGELPSAETKPVLYRCDLQKGALQPSATRDSNRGARVTARTKTEEDVPRRKTRSLPSGQNSVSRRPLGQVRNLGSASNLPAAPPKRRTSSKGRQRKGTSLPPLSAGQDAMFALTSPGPRIPKVSRTRPTIKQHTTLKAQRSGSGVHNSNTHSAPASARAPSQVRAAPKVSLQISSTRPSATKRVHPAEKQPCPKRRCSQEGALPESAATVPSTAPNVESVHQPASIAPSQSAPTSGIAAIYFPWATPLQQAFLAAVQEQQGSDPAVALGAHLQPASVKAQAQRPLLEDCDLEPLHGDGEQSLMLQQQSVALPASQQHRSDSACALVGSNLEQDLASFPAQVIAAGSQQSGNSLFPTPAPQPTPRSARLQLTDTIVVPWSHPAPAACSTAAPELPSDPVPPAVEQVEHDVRHSTAGYMQPAIEEESTGRKLRRGLAAAVQLAPVRGPVQHVATTPVRRTRSECSDQELHSIIAGINGFAQTSMSACRAFKDSVLLADQGRKQNRPLWDDALIRSRRKQGGQGQERCTQDQAVGGIPGLPPVATYHSSVHTPDHHKPQSKADEWLQTGLQKPVFSAQGVPSESLPSPFSAEETQASPYEACQLAWSHPGGHNIPGASSCAPAGHSFSAWAEEISERSGSRTCSSTFSPVQPRPKGPRRRRERMQHASIQTTPSLLHEQLPSLDSTLQTVSPHGCSLPEAPAACDMHQQLTAASTTVTVHVASSQDVVRVSAAQNGAMVLQNPQQGTHQVSEELQVSPIAEINAKLEHLERIIMDQRQAAEADCGPQSMLPQDVRMQHPEDESAADSPPQPHLAGEKVFIVAEQVPSVRSFTGSISRLNQDSQFTHSSAVHSFNAPPLYPPQPQLLDQPMAPPEMDAGSELQDPTDQAGAEQSHITSARVNSGLTADLQEDSTDLHLQICTLVQPEVFIDAPAADDMPAPVQGEQEDVSSRDYNAQQETASATAAPPQGEYASSAEPQWSISPQPSVTPQTSVPPTSELQLLDAADRNNASCSPEFPADAASAEEAGLSTCSADLTTILEIEALNDGLRVQQDLADILSPTDPTLELKLDTARTCTCDVDDAMSQSVAAAPVQSVAAYAAEAAPSQHATDSPDASVRTDMVLMASPALHVSDTVADIVSVAGDENGHWGPSDTSHDTEAIRIACASHEHSSAGSDIDSSPQELLDNVSSSNVPTLDTAATEHAVDECAEKSHTSVNQLLGRGQVDEGPSDESTARCVDESDCQSQLVDGDVQHVAADQGTEHGPSQGSPVYSPEDSLDPEAAGDNTATSPPLQLCHAGELAGPEATFCSPPQRPSMAVGPFSRADTNPCDSTPCMQQSREFSSCSISEPLSDGDVDVRRSAAFSSCTISVCLSDGESEPEEDCVSARAMFGSIVCFDAQHGTTAAVEVMDTHSDMSSQRDDVVIATSNDDTFPHVEQHSAESLHESAPITAAAPFDLVAEEISDAHANSSPPASEVHSESLPIDRTLSSDPDGERHSLDGVKPLVSGAEAQCAPVSAEEVIEERVEEPLCASPDAEHVGSTSSSIASIADEEEAPKSFARADDATGPSVVFNESNSCTPSLPRTKHSDQETALGSLTDAQPEIRTNEEELLLRMRAHGIQEVPQHARTEVAACETAHGALTAEEMQQAAPEATGGGGTFGSTSSQDAGTPTDWACMQVPGSPPASEVPSESGAHCSPQSSDPRMDSYDDSYCDSEDMLSGRSDNSSPNVGQSHDQLLHARPADDCDRAESASEHAHCMHDVAGPFSVDAASPAELGGSRVCMLEDVAVVSSRSGSSFADAQEATACHALPESEDTPDPSQHATVSTDTPVDTRVQQTVGSHDTSADVPAALAEEDKEETRVQVSPEHTAAVILTEVPSQDGGEQSGINHCSSAVAGAQELDVRQLIYNEDPVDTDDDDEDIVVGEYVVQMQQEIAAAGEGPCKQRREQAAVMAELVTAYCGRLLDIFISNKPETIFDEALTPEVFHCLESQILAETGTTDPFNWVAFNAVNGSLTSLYTRCNRLQKDHSILWKPAPRQKKLPSNATLKATILQIISDGCKYQPDPRDHYAIDEGKECDPEAEWYSEKVVSVRNDDVHRMQADVATHNAARELEDQSMALKCIAEIHMDELMHEIAAAVFSIDSHLEATADDRALFAAAQAQEAETAPAVDAPRGAALAQDSVELQQDQAEHAPALGWVQQNAGNAAVIESEGNMMPWQGAGAHYGVVDLIGIEAPLLQVTEGEEDARAEGHGNMYMHEGGVLAFDPDNEVAMGEAPLEEESSSRSAYDKRRAYSFKFCSLALDTFLQDIPEELPESRPVLDRKAISRVAQESGLHHAGANALHIEMLDRLLLDVYARLNRTSNSAPISYLPQPPHRKLPDKEKLKSELLGKVSCMSNPPWEPACREDGGAEEVEKHRCHANSQLALSLESCSLHSKTTAVSDGSKLLMAVASELVDMLCMETAASCQQ